MLAMHVGLLRNEAMPWLLGLELVRAWVAGLFDVGSCKRVLEKA